MMRTPRGFTLLEVMLALTILAIVSATLYGTFSRTLRSRAIAEEHVDITRTGRSALGRMTDELAAAFYSGRAGSGEQASAIFRSLPGGTEDLRLDAVAFSALAPRPSGLRQRGAARQVISYFFAEERGGMRSRRSNTLPDEVVDVFAAFGPIRPFPDDVQPHRLLRREALILHDNELAPATATLFLDNVASLDLRFHDGREWADDWDSEDRTDPVPRAVALDLGLFDTWGEVHHFATAIDLPLARRGRRPSSFNGDNP